MGPKHLYLWVDFLGDLHDIISDTLTLSITIKPQYQKLAASRVIPDILGHTLLLLMSDLLQLDRKKFIVHRRLPIFALGRELIVLDVTQH